MHIPNSMLQGAMCPITAVAGTMGIAAAAYGAVKSKIKPSAARFGAITALIFAGQMMNFPIQDGTSGHLLGGVLAVAMLGIPFGMLSIALVLAIQCLVFSDGGISVLGANILNMAIFGAGLGGLINVYLSKRAEAKSFKRAACLGFAAWASVLIAAFACSVELAISGTIPFFKVVGAMLGTHAMIGIGEGLITVAACLAFVAEEDTDSKWSVAAPLTPAVVIGMMLSPFASGFPDGLEWVAQKYQFLHESAPSFVSPMPDYSIPVITNEMVSTGLAGFVGVLFTFILAWMTVKVINFSVGAKAAA